MLCVSHVVHSGMMQSVGFLRTLSSHPSNVLLAVHVEISEFRDPWPPKKKAMPTDAAMAHIRAARQDVVFEWSGDACLTWDPK